MRVGDGDGHRDWGCLVGGIGRCVCRYCVSNVSGVAYIW